MLSGGHGSTFCRHPLSWLGSNVRERSDELRGRHPEAAVQSWVLLVTGILALLAGQVAVVAVWRLLTMVRRNSVFSEAAFRHVDLFI